MPDTFTPNYNLVMPGIGGDVNTWGTLLNNNFSLIDTGMAANLDLAGTRTMTGNVNIRKANPAVRFTDTNQTLPAGAWQLQSSGNNFQLLRNTAAAGDFSTNTVPVAFSATDGVSLLGTLTVNGALTAASALTVNGALTAASALTVNGALTAASATFGAGITTGTSSGGSIVVPNNQGLFSRNLGGSLGKLIGIGSDNNVDIQNNGANVRILNQTYTTALFVCDGVGNVTASGNITAFSDERLKTDWKPLPKDFVEAAAQATVGTYTRKDSGERQAGTVAQEWLAILGEVVGQDADSGMYSMAYGNAALVLACELAKRVVALEALVRDELK